MNHKYKPGAPVKTSVGGFEGAYEMVEIIKYDPIIFMSDCIEPAYYVASLLSFDASPVHICIPYMEYLMDWK